MKLVEYKIFKYDRHGRLMSVKTVVTKESKRSKTCRQKT